MVMLVILAACFLLKAQTPRLLDPGRDRILAFAFEHQLNEEQSNALLQTFKQRATLIQGPPGTGKTKLAHCIVCAHEYLSNATTLLTACSNSAVDNLAQTCLQKLQRGLARVCSQTYEPVLLESERLTPEFRATIYPESVRIFLDTWGSPGYDREANNYFKHIPGYDREANNYFKHMETYCGEALKGKDIKTFAATCSKVGPFNGPFKYL